MIGHDQLLELRQLIVADLPLRYNDGRPVEQNMILAFERDFSKVTNGWRRSEGVGQWWSPSGECFRDPNLRYEFTLVGGWGSLVEILEWLRRILGQLEMYAEHRGRIAVLAVSAATDVGQGSAAVRFEPLLAGG